MASASSPTFMVMLTVLSIPHSSMMRRTSAGSCASRWLWKSIAANFALGTECAGATSIGRGWKSPRRRSTSTLAETIAMNLSVSDMDPPHTYDLSIVVPTTKINTNLWFRLVANTLKIFYRPGSHCISIKDRMERITRSSLSFLLLVSPVRGNPDSPMSSRRRSGMAWWM